MKRVTVLPFGAALAAGLLLFFGAPARSVAQSTAEPPPVKLAEVPKELLPVDFVASAPVIDGVLDAGLTALPRRGFSQVDPFRTDAKPVEAHFRLAYGTDFLYVYVEAQGDRLTFNDRAYQNGDGFHMVIAKPRPGNAPSDEFYVAACSAVDRPELEWSRRLFWYYNVDKIFVAMSPQAKLASAAHDGLISFELLLPWQDLHPYHPWLSDGIGFNIGFVKASGQGALYYRLLPEDLGQENQPRRYIRLRFAQPSLESGMQTFVRLERNRLERGEPLRARAVTVSAGDETEILRASVLSGEGTSVARGAAQYACPRGLTFHEFGIDTADLPPGGYRVAWGSQQDYSKGDDSGRAAGLTVMPRSAADLYAKRLEKVKSRLSPGSATTLRYLFDEAVASLRAAKPYETAGKERMALIRVDEDLAQAEAGRDMFAARMGYMRRAFRSKFDGTLQPYAVRVPAGFDPRAGKKYPLVVYLHGSASDETNLAGVDYLSQGDCIELAPRGRGPSNGFTRDHAQEDIEEAIAAVIQSYPIDETRIILTGFSMGGYGVYRTFYEHPERYRAAAVFSGLPDLGNLYFPGEGHPSFLDDKNLARFKGLPLFIFHGKEDRNCPFATTRELVGKLERAGAKVEFVTEPGAGHARPNPETIRRYQEWLAGVLR
jgi:predicted esterase